MARVTKYISVVLGDEEHKFVLFTGMETGELVALFRSAFRNTLSLLPHQTVWIIGLEKESDGSLVALDDVCDNPNGLASNERYGLMLSGAPPARSLPAPAGMVEDTLSADLMAARNEMFSSFEGDERKTREMSTGTMEGTMDDSMAVLGGGDWTDEGGEDEEEDDEDEDDDDDDESAAEAAIAIKDDKAVVGALASFVEDCFSSKLFSEEEIGALDVLLGGGKPVPVTSPRGSSGGGIDPVVRAAYLVSYAQGRDAQLLFAVLKDLAAKQLTPDGREEHVAQEELIDMVHVLVDGGHLSETGMLHLYNLIVRKAHAIVDIYKAYGEHCEDEIVMEQLLDLAAKPGIAVAVQTEEEEKEEAKKQTRWEVSSHDTVGSEDSLVSPSGRHELRVDELPQTRQALASALTAKARPYLPHAAAVGHSAQAVAQHADATRASEDLTALTHSMHLKGELSPGDAEVAMQLIDTHNPLLLGAHKRYHAEEDPTGLGGVGDDEHLRELLLAVVRAERARRRAVQEAHTAHDEPSWASLPKPLLNLLQVAESRGSIPHDDAILVCNAFVHKSELVHAGWEVFEQDGDEAELFDTLVRIVKSGRLHEQMRQLAAAQQGTTFAGGTGSEAQGGDYEDDFEDDDDDDDDEEDSDDIEFAEGGLQGPSPGTWLYGSNGDKTGSQQPQQEQEQEQKTGGMPWQAQDVLRTVAGKLESAGMLQPHEADALVSMGEAGEEVVIEAFQVYSVDKNLDELIDTLLVVGREAGSDAAHREGFDDTPAAATDAAEEEANKDGGFAADTEAKVKGKELLDLVQCLREDGKVSPSEAAVLNALIHRREPRVMAAHDVYVMSRDVDELIDTLQRISRLALSGAIDVFGSGEEDQDSDEDDDDEEESDGDDDDDYYEDGEGHRLPDERPMTAPGGGRPGTSGGSRPQWPPRQTRSEKSFASETSHSTTRSDDAVYGANTSRGTVDILDDFDDDDDDDENAYEENDGRSEEGATEEDDGEEDDDDEDDDEDERMKLSTDERKEVLLRMLERGALSEDEAIVLIRRLLVSDDPEVAEAFDYFEDDHDGAALLADLKEIAGEDINEDENVGGEDDGVGPGLGKVRKVSSDEDGDDDDDDDDDDDSTNSDKEATRAAMEAYSRYAVSGSQGVVLGDGSDEDEDDDDDEEEEEEVDANTALDEDVGADRELAQMFMGVVRGMSLSENEAMALRLCIARDDLHVRAALEVFKLERDEDDLRDTLKRIARRTVEETMRTISQEKSRQ